MGVTGVDQTPDTDPIEASSQFLNAIEPSLLIDSLRDGYALPEDLDQILATEFVSNNIC